MTSENFSHPLSPLLSKHKIYSEKCAKKQMCLLSRDHMINHNENEDENGK